MLYRLRSLDESRRGALAACAGVLIALFCPWSRQTAVTSGVARTLRLHQTMSGWQSLSLSAVIALIVSLGVPALLLASGGREATVGRRRLTGAIVAAAGALAAIVMIIAQAGASSAATPSRPATVHMGAGWGVSLALLFSAVLMLLGVTMVRTSVRQPHAARRPRSPHSRGPGLRLSRPHPETDAAPVDDAWEGFASDRPSRRAQVRTGAARTRTARSPRR